MMQANIASQILGEAPSESPAPVNATSESSEQTTEQSQNPANQVDERFGVFAKMERKLKEREQQMNQKEQEWSTKGSKLAEYEEFMKLFDENPLEALKKKKGWGVQEFNEFAVKHSEDEDMDPVANITRNLTNKIAELEKSWEQKLNDAIKAKEEEIQGKDHERQIVEFKSGIKSFLAENKDNYEFIHAEEGGMEAVYDLIVQDVQRQRESGVEDSELRVMDIKDAAERVESFLDKQYSKYLSLKKVKSKFVQDENPALSAVLKSQSVPQTLNSSFSPKSKSQSELSAEERRQQAIELIRSQKQS